MQTASGEVWVTVQSSAQSCHSAMTPPGKVWGTGRANGQGLPGHPHPLLWGLAVSLGASLNCSWHQDLRYTRLTASTLPGWIRQVRALRLTQDTNKTRASDCDVKQLLRSSNRDRHQPGLGLPWLFLPAPQAVLLAVWIHTLPTTQQVPPGPSPFYRCPCIFPHFLSHSTNSFLCFFRQFPNLLFFFLLPFWKALVHTLRDRKPEVQGGMGGKISLGPIS